MGWRELAPGLGLVYKIQSECVELRIKNCVLISLKYWQCVLMIDAQVGCPPFILLYLFCFLVLHSK